jgi:uncharacterized membrane protein YphA (DoxX/SURF4 family)
LALADSTPCGYDNRIADIIDRTGIVLKLFFSPAAVNMATIAVRIALGAVFILSSVGKIADPSGFAAIVTHYRLLPPPLVALTAVVFPWVEIVCGMALMVGRLEKGAALTVAVMMVAFVGIHLYNGYRGLNIACGCFSLSAQAPSSIFLNTVRNLLLLAAAAWVLVWPRTRWSTALQPGRRSGPVG